MTSLELGQKFDVLFNSIASNQCPELDNYEKSVILTQAQHEIIRAFFNPEANKLKQGFDDTIIRQSDFAPIITTTKCQKITDSSIIKLHPNSILFELPSNLLYAINEQCNSENTELIYTIIPIQNSKFTELMLKPYKFPPKDCVWKLINTYKSNKSVVELVGNFNAYEDIAYVIRYVKTVAPIITGSLNGVSIEGQGTPQTLELSDELYDIILKRAVEIAKSTYTSIETQTQAQVGAQYELGNSGTELGIINSKNNQ